MLLLSHSFLLSQGLSGREEGEQSLRFIQSLVFLFAPRLTFMAALYLMRPHHCLINRMCYAAWA